ncbi:DeoR/GlpR family DNA-binding transcription regulator [Aggregatilinea lenta]|uniref:DeoR/GlpR family DNA-binding transcription regulator n=1 Tax=Aggregatilinea lenta TaxID=913108 RepID=UPI000E5C38D8|nr:DeoR/GlpR family DNA-binding transcription regulator [Aggregatilinea lenta]
MKNSNSLRRQDHIMQLLAQDHCLSINHLAALLDVSGWTIRRDLVQLEARNLVLRSHGAVELAGSEEVRQYAQSMQRQENRAIMVAKARIGARAADLLQDHTQVAMGAGSTTLACARAIKQNHCELVVMTNGLDIAIELTGVPHINLICTGGAAHGDFFTLTGPVAKRAIKSHYFDVAVVGVSGISPDAGLTADSHLNAEILELMIQNAQWVIALADHRKFGRVRFAKLADLCDVDVIVTDCAPEPEMAASLAQSGVEVVVAEGDDVV